MYSRDLGNNDATLHFGRYHLRQHVASSQASGCGLIISVYVVQQFVSRN